jgi:tetratricopeptide (TPR) repeat protein
MKRMLIAVATVASLLMLVSFVACSGPKEPATDETAPAETVAPETTAPEAAAPEPVTAIDWQREGVNLTLAGKNDEALTALNKAIELDPKLSIAYYNRGMVYKNLGQNDKALADFKVACDDKWDAACSEYKKLGGN